MPPVDMKQVDDLLNKVSNFLTPEETAEVTAAIAKIIPILLRAAFRAILSGSAK
jgi:hypothetical protein